MSKVHLLVIRIMILGVIIGAATLLFVPSPDAAQTHQNDAWIIGKVFDPEHTPLEGASVDLIVTDTYQSISHAETQADGQFALLVEQPVTTNVSLHIERAHFQATDLQLSRDIIESLAIGTPVAIGEITLARHINSAFWIATAIFLLVLVLIATGKLHNTLAALVGSALIFLISYLGEPISEDLYIFTFDEAIKYIDWNVIFLVMGMMIFIAVVEQTGIFQWLAFFAYRVSGGRTWLLVPVLMFLTGIASAILDNVTTMLMLTPISVQIALALEINPLALIIPEVMASNVMGVSTLIGTPTNILIGSFGDISFNGFLTNLTPGVLMAFTGLVIYSLMIYRHELRKARPASPQLLNILEQRGKITRPEHLKKAGIVGLGMLLLFIFGEHFHLLPAVTAIISATALMVWIKPDIEEMIEAVDWTTLVFFMALFIVVGAIQEVGLIGVIAETIGQLVGQNLALSMLAVIWFGAILSTVVANIPFTAAMLPVIGYLTATVPGAESKVLFFCLSIGSAMGGNGSLIGASANMVAAGIANRVGYPITYTEFLKKGFPALLITVGLASVWLFIHFH